MKKSALPTPTSPTLPTRSRGRFRNKTATLSLALALTGCGSGIDGGSSSRGGGTNPGQGDNGESLFRSETFGMEHFWSDIVGLDSGFLEAETSPLDALSLGLNLDAALMDFEVRDALLAELDTDLSPTNAPTLHDPAVFQTLLGQGAVVGLVPVDGDGIPSFDFAGPDSLSLSCALCHSTVGGSPPGGGGGDALQRGAGSSSLAGKIGGRIDGPAPAGLRVGALLALAENSRALYPYLPQSHETIGGEPIARTGAFADEDATEAEVDALLRDPNVFPAGMWDMTPDGIGNPLVIPPVYGLRDFDRYGIAGEFSHLTNALNAHITLGLDPTTLLTPSGSDFLQAVAPGIGVEIVNEYSNVIDDLDVVLPAGGFPIVSSTLVLAQRDESAPTGYHVDLELLAGLNNYLRSLTAPVKEVGDASARMRGAQTYALNCASCHGALEGSVTSRGVVSLLDLMVPYAPTTLMARGFPFSDMLNDLSRSFDDRLVVFDRVYSATQVPAQARDILVPSLKGLHDRTLLMHDGSVDGLEAVLDSGRGAGAPHPFYVDGGERADLIEFLTRR